MKLESIKQVLMRRDKMTAEEADDMIADAKEQIAQGADPEDILHDDFGLEPDYIFDLIDF